MCKLRTTCQKLLEWLSMHEKNISVLTYRLYEETVNSVVAYFFMKNNCYINLNVQVVSLPLLPVEGANVCAVIDTLVNQDGGITECKFSETTCNSR